VAALLPAHRVATPVLERLAGEVGGLVLGAGATAAWVNLGGFVVALTTREVPLLPNAVALAAGSGALAGVRPGAAGRAGPGRVELGGLRVSWDPATPPAWDPAIPMGNRAQTDPAVTASAAPGRPRSPAAQETVGRRGAALLQALGVRIGPHPDPSTLVQGLAGLGLATAADPDGAAGLALLFRAVGDRDPDLAAGAARRLLGRGPGLTPEGDDLLAAVAGTLAVLGPGAGLAGPTLDALLAALTPTPGRTTALSTTLLELAAKGLLAEPAGRLLDLGPTGEATWPAALGRLEQLGHGSGRAYAAGIAAGASLLAAGQPVG
jgi:uncharacterized protein DUF2877